MRVITGFARGRRLCSPEGSDIRPTGEKTKEAVFSILQNELEGAEVLDLFAGSGQMGIEALSRGARTCVFVDESRRALDLVRENLRRTRMEDAARVMPGDYAAYLSARRGGQTFDIAFLDPPYAEGFYDRALSLCAGAMKPGGVIVCESDCRAQLPERAGSFRRVKEHRYGKSKITLYRASPEGEA